MGGGYVSLYLYLYVCISTLISTYLVYLPTSYLLRYLGRGGGLLTIILILAIDSTTHRPKRSKTYMTTLRYFDRHYSNSNSLHFRKTHAYIRWVWVVGCGVWVVVFMDRPGMGI